MGNTEQLEIQYVTDDSILETLKRDFCDFKDTEPTEKDWKNVERWLRIWKTKGEQPSCFPEVEELFEGRFEENILQIYEPGDEMRIQREVRDLIARISGSQIQGTLSTKNRYRQIAELIKNTQ